MSTEPERRLVSISTIEAETELSRSTINRKINDGTLKRVKIGNATRVTGDSYSAFLASLSYAA